MAEQKAEINAARRRAKAGKKAGLKAEKTLAETQEPLVAAQEDVEQEREARIKAEKALTEDREALSAARLELEREHEARIEAEKGRAEAERAFEEARITKTDLGEDMETPLKTLREEGAEQRASFIVRLTVDARGEPRRTEVEDVQSGKKETFAALDGERLTAFMRACIGTLVISEPAVPPPSPSAEVGIPVPKPAKQSASLNVSEVQVFRIGAAVAMALPLRPNEPFVIQARFQLQGPDARSLTAQKSSYEMKVFANKVTSSESKLLTTYNGNLAKDVLEYTAQRQAPGLSPGLYRLVLRVTLGAPNRLAGYHEGPVIRVI
jgi:hypothetical protein